MYVGYDSTQIELIPLDAQLVLPYKTGRFANETDARRRFPHSIIQTIDVLGTTPASFLDIEKGDATPDRFVRWHQEAEAAGFWRPGYYCDESTVPTVDELIRQAGLERRRYRRWVANPTGKLHLPDGFDGCQSVWSPGGVNIDVSLFASDGVPPIHLRPHRRMAVYVEVDITDGHWRAEGVPVRKHPISG